MRPLVACALVACSQVSCVGMVRPSYVAQPNAMANLGSNLALAPGVVFQDGTGSVSYHPPVFADLPARTEVRDVRGRACESGLQVPWGLLSQPSYPALYAMSASVGWGDSGYQAALRDAANQVAPDALLYDVRVDLQTINVLSIWRQACVIVTASVVTRLPDESAAEDARAQDGLVPAAAPNPGDLNAPTR